MAQRIRKTQQDDGYKNGDYIMKIMKIMQKTMQKETTTDRKTDRKIRRRKGAAAAVIALAVAAAAAGTSAYASSEDSTSGGFFSTVAEVLSDLLFEDTDDAAAAASAVSTDEAAAASEADLAAAADESDDSDDSTAEISGVTIDLFNYTTSSSGTFGSYYNDGSEDGSFYGFSDNASGGINNGHLLGFVASGKSTYSFSSTYLMPWNIWTGNANNNNGWSDIAGSDSDILSYLCGSYQNIVAALQGSDGYPVLDKDTITVRSTDYEVESLAYLFDAETSTIAEDSTDEFQSKKSYTNVDVGSLLSVEDGYYVYDSDDTYATLDTETAEADDDGFYTVDGASFETESLADAQSDGNVSTSLSATYGFFPFNSLSEQYAATANSSSTLDHYFGLHMSSSFVQNDGGTASDGNEMIFEFTGDDDVWIFVDDVLVGDIGGIHDALDININFATGAVTLYYCTGDKQVDTTIYALYAEAFADETVTTSEDSDGNTVWTLTATDSSGSTVSYDFVDGTGENETATTFADNTEHLLDFYYLERGNGGSNLQLKFNLVQPEPTTLHKVDQDGEAVKGAGFSMFASNEDYTQLYLADGTTLADYDPDTDSIVLWDPDTESIVGDDEDGGSDSYFRIQYANGTLSGELLSIAGGNTDSSGDVTLTNVYGINIDFSLLDYTYFVLVETTTPDGYQTSADGHLYFDGNTLRSANLYTSGVYTVPGESISFSGSATAYKYDTSTGDYITFGTTNVTETTEAAVSYSGTYTVTTDDSTLSWSQSSSNNNNNGPGGNNNSTTYTATVNIPIDNTDDYDSISDITASVSSAVDGDGSSVTVSSYTTTYIDGLPYIQVTLTYTVSNNNVGGPGGNNNNSSSSSAPDTVKITYSYSYTGYTETTAAGEDDVTVDDILDASGSYTDSDGETASGGGSIYGIVLMQSPDSTGETNDMYAVAGNNTDGYTYKHITYSNFTAAMAGLDATYKYTAAIDELTGLYTIDIDELPGTLAQYTNYNENAEEEYYVTYVVLLLYEDADGNVSILGTGDDYLSVNRAFSTTIYVTDFQNRFIVQKVDENGDAVNGATFALFTRDEIETLLDVSNSILDNLTIDWDQVTVDVDEDGNYILSDGTNSATSVQSGVTQDVPDDGINLAGVAVFNQTDSSSEETNGVYYLVEVSAPTGYEKSEDVVVLFSDSEGVHANAGTDDDSVRTMVGAGRVAKSLYSYVQTISLTNEYDSDNPEPTTYHNTLTDITIQKLVGTYTGADTSDTSDTSDTVSIQDFTWTATEGANSSTNVTYSPDEEDTPIEYGPLTQNDTAGLWSDAGWASVSITQYYTDAAGTIDTTYKINLTSSSDEYSEDVDITELFNHSVLIQVSDESVAGLEVTKEVTVADASYSPDENTQFAYTLSLYGVSEDSDGTTTTTPYSIGFETVQASDVNGFLIYTDSEGNIYYYNAVTTTGALFKNGTTDEVDSESYTTGTDEETGFLTITLVGEDGEAGEELTAKTTTLYYYTYEKATTETDDEGTETTSNDTVKIYFEVALTYDVTTMDSEGTQTTTSVTEDAELTVMKDGSPVKEGEEGDSAVFYLKNGQTIHFYGLENGVGYTVTETGVVVPSASSDDTTDSGSTDGDAEDGQTEGTESTGLLAKAKTAVASLFGLDDEEDETVAAAEETGDSTDGDTTDGDTTDDSTTGGDTTDDSTTGGDTTDEDTTDDTTSDSTTDDAVVYSYGVCGTAHTSHSVEAALTDTGTNTASSCWTLVNRYTYAGTNPDGETIAKKTVYTTDDDSTESTDETTGETTTTYNTAAYTISGEVTWSDTDDTDPSDRFVFENEYEPASTTLASGAFTAQKTLTGRAFLAGDTYTFALAAVDGAALPDGAVTDDNGTSVVWMQLQVTEDESGDLVYTVYAVDADGNILYQTDDDGNYVTDEDKNKIPVYSQTLTLTTTTDEEGNTTYSLSPFSFGDIVYTKAGTFTYTIYEVEPDADDDGSLPGVDYSHASYTVTVVVTDDGVGNLSVSSSTVTMTQTDDNTGSTINPAETVETKNATFTNSYTTDTDTVSFLVYKDYTDKSGITSLEAGMFTYTLTAVGGFDNLTVESDSTMADTLAKTLASATSSTYTISASDVPVSSDYKDGSETDSNGADGRSSFTEISYELSQDTGKTYVYKLTENGSSDSFFDGLTYDTTTYYLVVVNTTSTDDSGNDIIVSTAYYFKEVTTTATDETTGETTTTTSYEQVEPGSNQAGLEVTYATFTNTYEIKDAASVTIQGQKTLDGITLDGDEGFTFCLATTDEATLAAINAENIVYVTTDEDGNVTETTLSVNEDTGVIETQSVSGEGTTGVQTFSFNELTFKTGGTYVFTVYEDTTSLTNGSGYMYDYHVATVTIMIENVLNEKGQYTGTLRVSSISYDNSASAVSSDAAITNLAAFTNLYRAVEYDGFDISKTLSLAEDSELTNFVSSVFTFEVEALDYTVTDEETEETTTVTSAAEAAKLLNISSITDEETNTTSYKTTVTSSALSLSPAETDDDGTTTKEAVSTATATISFNDIIGTDSDGNAIEILFTQDDVGKTYTYKITETDLGAAGFTYDETYYIVTIVVTDESGVLTVTTTVTHYDEDGIVIEETGNPSVRTVTSSTTSDESEDSVTASFENTYEETEDEKTVTDDSGDDVDGSMVGVGDVLTYTVNWTNDAIDSTTGLPAAAKVVISDIVPTGTTYNDDAAFLTLKFDGITYTISKDENGSLTVTASDDSTNASIDAATDEDDTTIDGSYVLTIGEGDDETTITLTVVYDAASGITWTIDKAPAGATGSVGFSATVSDDALGTLEDDETMYSVSNYATVKVGDNDPRTTTSTDSSVPSKTGSVTDAEGETVDDDEGLQEGDIINYTIAFMTDEGASSTTVTDPLSQGLQFYGYDYTGSSIVTVKNSGGTSTYYMIEYDADSSGYVVYTASYDEENDTYTRGEAVGSEGALTFSVTSYDSDSDPSQTLTWTITGLSGGEEITITFDVAVTLDTLVSVDNSASVDNHWTNSTTIPTDDDSHKTVTQSVTTTDEEGSSTTTDEDADGQTVSVGDVLTYHVQWYNDGNGDSSTDKTTGQTTYTVTVTDEIPDNVEYVSGSAAPSGSYALYNADGEELEDTEENASSVAKIVWTFTNQALGAKGEVSFKVTVVGGDSTTIENQATVNDSTKTEITTNYIGEKEQTNEDLQEKTEGLEVGDVLDYELSFTVPENTDGTAEVVDNLTQGLEYMEDSAKVTVNGTETNDTVTVTDSADDGGQTLTWNLTGLKAGDSVVITFSAEVTLESLVAVGNSFTVNGEESNTINTPTSVESSKSVEDSSGNTIDGEQVKAGDVLTYTIQWANNATDETTGGYTSGTVTIVDTLPEGVELVENSITGTAMPDDESDLLDGVAYYTVSTNSDGQTVITWTINNAAAGAKGEVSFKVTVTGEAATIENKASVNDVDTNSTTVYTPSKTATDESGDALSDVEVGDVITYTITAVNDTDDATTITITDTIPSGTEYVINSAKASWTDGETEYTASGDYTNDGTLTWTCNNVPAGVTVTATFDVTVTEDAVNYDSISNTSKVEIGENTYESNTSSTDTPDKTVSADLDDDNTLEDATDQMVGVGDELTYTIRWVVDEENVTTVTVKDTIPNGTALVEGSYGNGVLSEDGTTITWTITPEDTDYFEVGDSGTVSFTVTVTDDAVSYDDISNTASITVGENESYVTTETSNTIPKKTVEEVTDDDESNGYQVGDTLAYTIQWANTTDEAQTIVITDTLATGLAYVANSAGFASFSEGSGLTSDSEGVSVSYDSATNTITWTITDAPAGSSGTVTFEATITEAALNNGSGTEDESDDGVISNSATLNIGNDYTIDTNSTSTSVKTGDLSISKTVAVKNGADLDDYDDDVFAFTITLKDTSKNALSGTYSYTGSNMLLNEDGTYSENSGGGTLEFSSDGTATIYLKHGQEIILKDLPEGASYTIEETTSLGTGWSTSKSGDSGTIAEEGSNEAAFTNTYSPSSVTYGDDDDESLTVTKILSGRSWQEGDTFTFTLAAYGDTATAEGYTLPDDTELTVTYTEGGLLSSETSNDNNNTVTFGDITFTKAGTYTFSITESAGGLGGVTYDTTARIITIEVTDDGNGQLSASLKSIKDADGNDLTLTFTNTYAATESYNSGSGLNIVKNYTGDEADENEFTYTITAVDTDNGTTAAEAAAKLGLTDGTLYTTVSSGTAEATETGSTSTVSALSNLTFTQADAGKTYTYTISEQIPEGATANEDGTYTYNGVTYDNTTYTVAIEVIDDGDGTMHTVTTIKSSDSADSTVKIDSSTNATTPSVQFDNTYSTTDTSVDSSTYLNVTKVIEGRDWLETDSFTFTLTAGDETTSAAIEDSTITLPENAAGLTITSEDYSEATQTYTAAFGDITFSAAGTYTFTIQETKGNLGGVTYDTSVKTITVVVTDNGDGTLSATINDDTNPTFTNTYAAESTSDTVTAKKEVTSSGETTEYVMTAGTFSFTLINTAKPEGAEEIADQTKSNMEDAVITFDTYEFKAAGEYRFTLSENSSAEPGITKDGTVYTIIYNIADDGEGSLNIASKKIVDQDGNEVSTITYTNKYDTTQTAYTISGIKKITNTDSGTSRTAESGEFTFVLQDADGTVLQTTTNGADGFSFDEITYTEAGTYTYTVTEQKGDDSTITYDTTSYTVTVTVAEIDGKLTAYANYETSDIVFDNTYTPTSATVDGSTYLTGTKNLTGRALNEGDFSFVLQDAQGNTVDTAVNAADGSFSFGSLTFDETGTYTYTISEVDGGLGGVTYDDTVYTVTIKVTEDSENHKLVAEVSYGDADAATFTNVYTPDENTKEVSLTTADGESVDDADDSLVGVGDILTYTINWVCSEEDATEITITDTIPMGTELVEGTVSGSYTYDEENGVIVWTITPEDGEEYFEIGDTGSVSFSVEVTQAAAGSSIENEATVTIGDNEYTTNTTSNSVPEKTVEDLTESEGYQVGDTVQYTISWANTSDETAQVVITDALDDGLTLDESSLDDTASVTTENGVTTIVWTFDADAGASGTVTFRATINENALEEDGIANSASVKVGDSPEVSTNTTTTSAQSGALQITKTVETNGGARITDSAFVFTVTLTDTAGDPLTGTYYYYLNDFEEEPIALELDEDGEATVELQHGDSLIIQGLPEGAQYSVSEADAGDGYKTASTGETGTILADGTALAAFTNTYTPDEVTYGDDDDTALTVTKLLEGRDWTDGDTFSFSLALTGYVSAEEGSTEDADTALSEGYVTYAEGADAATITYSDGVLGLNATSNENNNTASFGTLTFTQTGTYTFTVTEDAGGITGITYDTSEKTIVIVVTDDDLDGQLEVALSEDSDELTFTNTYGSTITVDPSAEAGIEIEKTFSADELTEGTSVSAAFSYSIEAADEAAAVLLADGVAEDGVTTDTMTLSSSNLSVTDEINFADIFDSMTFTEENAGDTYVYTIKEVKPENASEAITYDDTVYTVTISVTDNGDGTLTVTITAVDDEGNTVGSSTMTSGQESTDSAISLLFENTYTEPTQEKTVETTTHSDADDSLLGVGDVLTYTIAWTNTAIDETTGEAAASTVVVTDTVPSGTEIVEDSVSKGGEYDAESKTVTWTIEAAAGESGEVSFSVTVTDEALEETTDNTIENTATVSVKIGDNDPNVYTTNTTSGTVPEKEQTDEELQNKTDGLEVGDELAYKLSFTAPADTDGTAAVVDELTVGLEYVEDSAVVTVNGEETTDKVTVTGDINSTGQTLTWNLTGLQTGDEVVITFKAKVTLASLVMVGNSYTVNGNESNTVTTPTSLKSTKTVTDSTGTTVDGEMVSAGDELTYTINWANSSTEAGDVTIVDSLPEGVTEVDGSISDDGELSSDGSTITWVIENAASGEKGTVSFKVTVTGEAESISNKALVNDVETNTTTTYTPVKTVMDSETKEALTTALVGQQMTYSIAYRNLGEEPGDIIITDTVPAGTQLVEGSISDEGSYTYDEETGEIVWTLTDVPAGYEGTVSFDVTVTEEAIEYDEINNTATVQLGENDPEIITNTTSVNVSISGIQVTKSVAGALADKEDLFTFTISLKDAYGNPLTNTYSYTGTLDGSEENAISGTISDGGSFSLKDGGTITIAKLPEGTQYEITEIDAKGYTATITVNGEVVQTASGSTSADETDEADITNTYSTSMSTPVSLDALFTKVLSGRDWTEDDAFAFVIEAVTADAPLPEETTVTVTSDTATDGEAVEFGFGEITFTEDDMEGAALNEDGYYQKTFTYTVTEVEGDNAGIDYSTNVAALTITVTDDGEGNLSGAPYVTAEESTFTNSYSSSMKFGSYGSVYLMKTLYGTTAEEGEFEFTMTAVDSDTVTAEETAEKLFGTDAGLSKVYTNTALDYDGDTCFISLYSGLDIVFDQDDAGKTYACTLSETKGGGTGYTNDDTVYTVTIRIADHGDGYLTAVHTITDDDGNTITRSFSNGDTVQDTSIYGPEFVNYYGARVTIGGDSDVSIEATKTLTGRSLKAREFTYVIEDAAGSTVATGKNAADGTISFREIEYTTETLAEAVENGTAVRDGDVYIFAYTVYEKTGSLGAGVSAGTYSFGITVTVTDNGDGTLSAEVTYPDGASSLEFENYYQTDAVDLTISGVKYLETENSTLSTSIADLAGAFSFTISADDAAAPLPEETTVTNDAAGNVSFGAVTFDESCFDSENTVTDADNNRSVTFTYTITENESSAGGVTNDSTTARTFTITIQEDVTEAGLSYVLVSASETDGALFTFTNTYAADDTSVTPGARKVLNGDGATLADGQFTFILADADGNVIDSAANDADGQITFGTITYSEAGIYEYTVYELDDGQEGITYDTTVYEVTVTVTDDGEGNLIAEVSSEAEDIVFINTYTGTGDDTPTTDDDTPTTDDDTPTTDEDTPTTDDDTPTTDDDTPTTDDDTPTTDDDTPTTDDDTPTTDDDTPTTDDDTPTTYDDTPTDTTTTTTDDDTPTDTTTTTTDDDTPTDTTTTTTDDDTSTDTTTPTTDDDTSTDTTTTTTDDDTSTDTTTTVSTSDGSGAGFWAILLIAAAAAITALGAGRRRRIRS